MRPLGFPSSCISTLLCVISAAAYFVVTQPANGTQWVNGQTNVLTWQKGLLDGVNGYDVELTRMSVDGLILVAKNVPAKPGALNLFIENVPAGDDYVVIFLNSSQGILQGTSQRFTILAASSTPTSTPQSSVAHAATVTVTSGPNPTLLFATTFPALPWSGASRTTAWISNRRAFTGVLTTVVTCTLGASYVLL